MNVQTPRTPLGPQPWETVRTKLDQAVPFANMRGTPYYRDAIYEQFSAKEYERRYAALRAKMKEHKLDAVIAAGVIALLTVVCVAAVDIFNAMALLRGGPKAIILPLGDLFDGIEKHPGAPEYGWVYLMLLSTMIPSLINLIIGGTSLFRGIPPVNALLLRNMPERHEPGAYDRTWMACLLTGQIFLGGLLGIAAQGALVYVMIWQVLPLFHDGLLNLARDVAAADVPLWVLAPFLK